jgi:hypothetical protein
VEFLDAGLAILSFAADGPAARTQDRAKHTPDGFGIIDDQNPQAHGPDVPDRLYRETTCEAIQAIP